MASEPGHTTLFIRTQSLYPPYIDYDMHNRWWDFGGSTVVNANRYVRLAPDMSGRKGWLRAKVPFTADSWSMEFEYKIHGRASGLTGDGLAFWFTKAKVETVGDMLGGPVTWDGLVLAFDTYDNGRHGYAYPYVAALYNDGTKKYDKETDGKALEIGGCQADIRNKDYATRARVRFVKDQYLKVDLNTKGWDEWTNCFSVNNVTLWRSGFLSFTGETGGLSDNHDIVSVSTNQLLVDDQSPHSQPALKNTFSSSFMTTEAQGPSFFTISVVIAAIAGIAYYVVKVINGPSSSSQRSGYKHF